MGKLAKFKCFRKRAKAKIYSPHTTRRENLPFEYKLNSKKYDKTHRKDHKKPNLASSKISSWTDVVGATSEMNSNVYRNKENQDINTFYPKNHQKMSKSCRRSGSTKRKRKQKHHLSVNNNYESNTVDNTNQNTFATQLISLMHQLNSPSGERKSHNHSQSEAYSENFKRIVHSKSGQHYKAKSKSSMHSRSNTTEGTSLPSHNVIKRITQLSKNHLNISQSDNRSRKGSKKARKSLKNCIKRQDGSQKYRSSGKHSGAHRKQPDGFTAHGESTTENTFAINPNQNKSMLGEGGGTFNSMGSMMKSF